VRWNGSSYAVSWSEKVAGKYRVFRALMDMTGVIAGSSVQASCTSTEDDFRSSIEPVGTSHSVLFIRGTGTTSRPRIRVF